MDSESDSDSDNTSQGVPDVGYQGQVSSGYSSQASSRRLSRASESHSSSSTDDEPDNGDSDPSDSTPDSPVYRPPAEDDDEEDEEEEEDTNSNRPLTEQPYGISKKREAPGGHSAYSEFSKRMMTMMGHKPGEGLGRSGGGILEPIKESVQRGRVGLGNEGVYQLESENVDWVDEEVSCKEVPEWITPCRLDLPSARDGLHSWAETGKRKKTIEDEIMFCDGKVLKRILKAKTVFDNLDRKAFLDSRDRSNPFELIKGIIFQNRAAMKMANMDAIFSFMFTNMRHPSGKRIIDSDDVLYFADICAGPGGFTEYVLFRTKWHAKGFGFTLKSPCDGSDFKLDEFHASNCETFELYYGREGDGDITNRTNLESFQQRVMDATGDQGLHFVMGDGGISVEGEENIQEILTKQLVMCQFLCAMLILRKGGNFVCKLFDMFTPFLVGLIYLLYRCFEKVSIIKPVTSRPANSERYVVCTGFRDAERRVAEYLLEVNDKLHKLKGTDEDILEVVPLDILQQEEDFMTYVTKSNDRIGDQQSTGLRKVQYFVKNRNLVEKRQAAMKDACLERWSIENTIRKSRTTLEHKLLMMQFWEKLTDAELDEATCMPETLSLESLPLDVHSWKWYYTSGARHFIVGCGRSNCKGWNQKCKLSFGPVPNTTHLELPPETILDVEVCEYSNFKVKKFVIEVVDAIAISGKYIGDWRMKDRHLQISKLCEALNQPGRPLMRLKQWYNFSQMDNALDLQDVAAGESKIPKLIAMQGDQSYTFPRGIVLSADYKAPWQCHYSRSNKALYAFDSSKNKSIFGRPPESCGSYFDCLASRKLWVWPSHHRVRIMTGLLEEPSDFPADVLTKSRLVHHVNKHSNM